MESPSYHGLDITIDAEEHLRREACVKLQDLITTINRIQSKQEVNLSQLLEDATIQIPNVLDGAVVGKLIELRNAIYVHQRPMLNLAYFEWKFGWKEPLYHYVRSLTRGKETRDIRPPSVEDAQAIMLFFAQGLGIASIFPADEYKLKTLAPWGEQILSNRDLEGYPNPYAYLHVMLEYEYLTPEEAAIKYFGSLGVNGLCTTIFWENDLPKLSKSATYRKFFASSNHLPKPEGIQDYPILYPNTAEDYNHLFYITNVAAYRSNYLQVLVADDPECLSYFNNLIAELLKACCAHAHLMEINISTMEYVYTIMSQLGTSELKRALIMHYVHHCIQLILSDQQIEDIVLESAADFVIAYYDPDYCIEGDQANILAVAKAYKYYSKQQILRWDGESKFLHEFFSILNMIQLGAMRITEAVTILKRFAKEFGDTNDFFQACLRSSHQAMREVALLYLNTAHKISPDLQAFRRVVQSPLPVLPKITEGLVVNSASDVIDGILPPNYSKSEMFRTCLLRYIEVEERYGIKILTQLYQQNGIIQHKRYTDPLLEYIIASLDQPLEEGQKHIVLISARNHYGEKYIDENTQHYADIAKQAQDNASAVVRYIEASTQHEMYVRLRQLARRFGKFDTVIIAAHSGPTIINLGGEDIKLEQLDVDFGLSPQVMGYVSNVCNEGSTIIMDCCKTGVEDSFADVLATSPVIHTVHASSTLNSVDRFVLDTQGCVTPIYTEVGHRIVS